MEQFLDTKMLGVEAKNLEIGRRILLNAKRLSAWLTKIWNSQLDYDHVNRKIQETRLKYESYRHF